jgi:hypothetical protein
MVATIPNNCAIAVTSGVVVFLNGEELETSNPRELGDKLLQVYRNPLPDEVLPDGRWIRFGYRCLTLKMRPDGGDDFQLTFEPPLGEKRWMQLGGPEVEGELYHIYSGLGLPTCIIPQTGRDLGIFFRKLSKVKVAMFIELKSKLDGVGSYDDFVALVLKPAPNVIGAGEVVLLRSHAMAETYRFLYRLEGGETEAGRGDHVGAYPGSHWGDDPGFEPGI